MSQGLWELEDQLKVLGGLLRPTPHHLAWRSRVEGGVAFDRVEGASVVSERLTRGALSGIDALDPRAMRPLWAAEIETLSSMLVIG
jgi:hypothetical protein